MSYYSNANPDLLAKVPVTARRVLEIGCGTGGFARAYRDINPACEYWGVELFADAAAEARTVLDHVVIGSIESADVVAALDEARGDRRFDVLIFGDVLEHLLDPWTVLETLRARMEPGAVVCVCVPNVGHWTLVREQLLGRWNYADAGLLDRTHLRFFSHDTSVEMLSRAGWSFLDADARVLWPEKTEAAVKALTSAAVAFGGAADKARKDLSAFQWVLRGINGPLPDRIAIAALGLKKLAGVTEARVDYPMSALASLPTVQAKWGAGTVEVPKSTKPGVFVLHRQFLNGASPTDAAESMASRGWVLVSDIDDDPHHWPEYVASDFRAFRGVHAVTVSTEPLAELIRQWNPNVGVFPNAAPRLPEIPSSTPKGRERMRIFFGALNREADWGEVSGTIMGLAALYPDRMEWAVVHDQAFFDALPAGTVKTFHPTLPHASYMKVMADCDLALLPLSDTPFNRLKSDLKLVECASAGAVPICSRLVYGDDPAHGEFAVFADTPEEWRQALLGLIASPDEVRRRRDLGRAHVAAHRMHATEAKRREAFYQDLVKRRVELEAERQARLGGSNAPAVLASAHSEGTKA